MANMQSCRPKYIKARNLYNCVGGARIYLGRAPLNHAFCSAFLMSSASLLKEEGNNLFKAGKFSEAKNKYTEAIAQDGQNAVLFANRAACALSLKECVSSLSPTFRC
jgi:hypothetical protein